MLEAFTDKSDDTQSSNTYALDESVTAAQWTEDITVGWVLADSFGNGNEANRNYTGAIPSSFYETYFGNPLVTKELIDAVHASGFNAVRIMISWGYNLESDGTIAPQWLARIAEVVQHALDNDMKVIITACDPNCFYSSTTDLSIVQQNIQLIWGQVAEYFKDYDYRVAFEDFNEVLNQKSRDNWEVTSAGVNVFNQMTQTWVNTIRQSGGKNLNRVLICNTWACNPNGIAVSEFQVPSDLVANKIAIEVHSYNGIMNELISQQLDLLNFKFIQNGYPVIYGEYAALADGSVSEEVMALQVSNFIASANRYGIKVFYYDSGLKTSYALFDRNTYQCFYPQVLFGLFKPQLIPLSGLGSKVGATEIVATSDLNTLSDNGVKSQKINVNANKKYIIQFEWEKTNLRLKGIKGYNSQGKLVDDIFLGDNTKLRIYEYVPGTSTEYFEIEVYNPWSNYNFEYYVNTFNANVILCATELPVNSVSYDNSKKYKGSEYESFKQLYIKNILNNEICQLSVSNGTMQIITYNAAMEEIQRSDWGKSFKWVCGSEAEYLSINWKGYKSTSRFTIKYNGLNVINTEKAMVISSSTEYKLEGSAWIQGVINEKSGLPEEADNAIYYNGYIPVELYNVYSITLPQSLGNYKWFVVALNEQFQFVENYGGYSKQDVLYITDEDAAYIEIYLQPEDSSEINYNLVSKSVNAEPVIISRTEKAFKKNKFYKLSELILGIRPNDKNETVDLSNPGTYIVSDTSATTKLLDVAQTGNTIGAYVKHGSMYIYEYDTTGKLIKKTLCRKAMLFKLDSNTKRIRLMGTYANHKDDTIRIWFSE